MKKPFVFIGFAILLTFLVGCAWSPELTPVESEQIATGCAGQPACMVAMTEEALESKAIQREFELEDKRLERRDKLIIFLNACDNALGVVIFEKKWVRSMLPTERERRKAQREYGYSYTHDNVHRQAHMTDFQCISPGELFRRLGQGSAF